MATLSATGSPRLDPAVCEASWELHCLQNGYSPVSDPLVSEQIALEPKSDSHYTICGFVTKTQA